jgi:hypothetical protein
VAAYEQQYEYLVAFITCHTSYIVIQHTRSKRKLLFPVSENETQQKRKKNFDPNKHFRKTEKNPSMLLNFKINYVTINITTNDNSGCACHISEIDKRMSCCTSPSATNAATTTTTTAKDAQNMRKKWRQMLPHMQWRLQMQRLDWLQ